MVDKRTKKKMEWHLYEMMAKRRIRTATDLQRKLAAIDVHISSTHLSRLLKTDPIRVTNELIWGLTEVLECNTNDLWCNPNRVNSGESEGESQKTKLSPVIAKKGEPKAARVKNDVQDVESLIGPKVSTFPRPGK